MKTTKIFCDALALAVMALSCTRETEVSETLNTGIEMEFTASWAEGEASKTVVAENGTDILWSVNERINAFYGTQYAGVFTSTNTEPSALVTFEGMLNILTGSLETENSQRRYWAIYPYNENNTCDGQSVTLSLPCNQIGFSGSFADKFFPAVACGSTPDLAFYNVCGGARFSIVTEGVKQVVFRSNDGSSMAGTVQISFGDDNKPQILELSNAIDSVVVNAPIGGFVPGNNYFAAMLPQTHEQGLTVTLYTATKRAVKSIDKSITVRRSTFGTLDNVDEGLEYEDYQQPIGPDPEGIIVFADDRIKAHCVAAFDTNGDGELSYGEAAAVTDVSTAFTSKLYTSFEEFRYFTGVTEIPANWFKDRARLKAIALPAGVTSVGNNAFFGCGAIEKVAVGGTLLSTTTMQTVFPDSYSVVKDWEILPVEGEYSICNQAFRNCSGLTRLTLPEGLRDIGTNAFQNCNNLTRLNIPSIDAWLNVTLTSASSAPFYSSGEGHLFIGDEEVTRIAIPSGLSAIGAYTFYNCTGIEEASFPESLQSIGSNAFYGCTGLSRINIPSLENWISLQYADAASAPFYAVGEGHLYISGTELKSIALPQSKTELGQYAFYNCTGIEELTLPSGLAKVNSNAFYGCKSLRKANIASLAAWMGITFENQGAAPFNASGEGHLFIGGKELKDPLIPEEVTAFGNYAFYNCTGITKMTLEPTAPPTLGSCALDGTRCYFVVWDECLNSYKSSWNSWTARIISEKALLGEEIVDLGLSVKWGICNLGAAYEMDYGFYYSWGEAVPKSSYDWSNYHCCNGSGSSINKYYDGDGKFLLDLEDDAAAVALGDKWRTPTSTEWRELIENCTWEWTTLGGVYGRKVTSQKEGYTDQWIFLPAAGYRDGTSLTGDVISGLYWSLTLNTSSPHEGYCMGFSSVSINPGGSCARYTGAALRPVFGDLVRVTGVSFEKTSIHLKLGESVQLLPVISPQNASEKCVFWSSSDSSVATVDENGMVEFVGYGKAEITVTTIDGGFTAILLVDNEYAIATPEIIDLGLSVKWASFNLGATNPGEYGDYFAWGETVPKSCYNWSTYKWCKDGSVSQLTKYCTYSICGYNGFTDNKTVLDPEDDAAAVNLGGLWRMPTLNECKELLEKCTAEWSTLNGIYGIKFTSNKEEYSDVGIFFPAAGYWDGMGFYGAGSYSFTWSSSLCEGAPSQGYIVFFNSGNVNNSYNYRYNGQSVRAVYGKYMHVTEITVSPENATVGIGETLQLAATITPSNASDKSLIWSSSDESVATVSDDGLVTAVWKGTAEITAQTVDGGYTATCLVTVILEQMVDLGLSVKWATCNVGASSPEEYGDYFAWGETEPKENYNWSTYKWCMNGNSQLLTKYCDSPNYGYNAFVDHKKVLDPEDAAAAVNLGSSWRMPTYNELDELKRLCTWKWTTLNGVYGRKVTSNKEGYTNKWIFLPAAGMRYDEDYGDAGSLGRYWSSSLSQGYPSMAYAISFTSGGSTAAWVKSTREDGWPIRPVLD